MAGLNRAVLLGAAAALGAGLLAPGAPGAQPHDGARAEPHQPNAEYSFIRGHKPKPHRAGVIKVAVRGLDKGTRAEVTIKRRTARFARPKLAANRFSETKRLKAGKRHVFSYRENPGHYLLVARRAKVNGRWHKAHKARVVVTADHGVRVKLRYVPIGHPDFPIPGKNAPHKGSNSTPLPPPRPTRTSEIAYPTRAVGRAASFDQGQGGWRQCRITWSFDPGPTARLGGDPLKEVKLLRGIFSSIKKLAGYDMVEKQSGAQIRIQMLDHVGAVNGITPSGLTTRPQGGSPFTSATIQLNGSSLLGSSHSPVGVRQNLYAHEIGHSLGLNHIRDRTQIMNPTVPNDPGWAAGDRSALRAMPSTC